MTAPQMPALTPFEGRDVLTTTIAIRNAGDGLSKAMEVQPVELHHGNKVYVVLECDVEKVRYDPVPETQALTRVHMLKAGTAVMVDKDLVGAHLEAMERRIEEHRGIERLPFDESLAAEHKAGKHASELVPRCEECQAEADAVAAERGTDAA